MCNESAQHAIRNAPTVVGCSNIAANTIMYSIIRDEKGLTNSKYVCVITILYPFQHFITPHP